MRASRHHALTATLAVLATILSGCGKDEDPPPEHVPCLGGCFTTPTTPSQPSSTGTTRAAGTYHDISTTPSTINNAHDNSGNKGGEQGSDKGNRGGNQGSNPGGNQGGNQGGNAPGNGNGRGATPLPVKLEPTMPAVRRCYLEPLWPGAGCRMLDRLEGDEFGLNFYGQETTAKRACLDRLRPSGGNAFVFGLGQCELWNCSSRDALRASAGPMESAGGTVSFGTWKNTLVSVGADGHLQGILDQVLPPAMPPKAARFELVTQQSGKVAIRSTSASRFVSAAGGGTLTTTAETVGDAETFDMVTNDDKTVSLRSNTGLYLSVRDAGPVLAVAPVADGWEKLVLINNIATKVQQPPANRAAGMQVFSELCQYQEMTGGRNGEDPRAPVFVKLWEWNFKDVARECQEFLGPNGFDAVQVAPVLEHVQGTNWWAKYKPVSYGLDSRSGSRQEFVDMVATCRAAGVEVLVDVIINHLADACPEAGASNGAHTPCVGWNGTRYGKRRSLGSRGWDAVDPSWFHHLPGREMDNCGVGQDTGYLCGGNDLRDCSCCTCDLYGLPDFNTGLAKVRELHTRHLFELHDIGVTMARVDASLYESPVDLAAVLCRVPWDTIYQEWWGEWPVEARTREVGLYRDVSYRWKIANGLSILPPERLPEILRLHYGVEGIVDKIAVYPVAYHDGRANEATFKQSTYKNGLAFHQMQKFLLAWPKSSTPILWGGFGWSSTEQGPPGCEQGDTCTPQSVFNDDGETKCLPTPTQTPLPAPAISEHRWICEHRWDGVAGLVNFRKACRGLRVSQTWASAGGAGNTVVARGHLAWRLGEDCFVALVRGHTTPTANASNVMGDWNLASLNTGLPAGRYCDLASLPTQRGWDRATCPREVTISDDGTVQEGVVRDGDLLAIHTGARLSQRRRLRAGEGK